MRATFLICIGLAIATEGNAQAPRFTPPPAEKIGALLDFPSPVTLALRIASKEELSRRPKRGVPLVGYSYSDPARTSQAISVAIYPAGEFLKNERLALNRAPTTQLFRTSDGRTILQFPLAFGPGGETNGVLVRCRNAQFEIVMTQQTDYHDDEDPKLFRHHVNSRKKLWEIVAAVEALVTP